MRYTKENIIDGIYAKIDEASVSDGIKRKWRRKLVDYPEEVEQNVLEWLNDQPISEIDCHGESIKRVLDYENMGIEWFPCALEGFVNFKNSHYQVPSRVWQYVYQF